MVRISAFDPIEYLVDRRYPCFYGSNARIDGLLGTNPQKYTEAQQAYEASLREKSPAEIATLVAEERAKEQLEAQQRAEHEEAQRFYNGPNSAPDYDHFCLLANWTLDEAVALSFGKNPEVVSTKTLAPLAQVSTFAKAYLKRLEVVERAKWAQQLFDPVLPSIFLAWAKSRFQLPDKLTSTAVDRGISLKGWHDLYEEAVCKWQAEVESIKNTQGSELTAARAALADSMRHVAELQDRLAAALKPVKPVGRRELANLQLLLFACAVRAYDFDPEARSNAATRMSRDMDLLGHPFSDDSIRKHLQEGFQDVPPGWRDRMGLKPNSGSR